MSVLGVDGCRGGWAGIVLDEGRPVLGLFAPGVAALAEQAGRGTRLDAIGVDMPIGLPDAGRRQADVLARRQLGPRRSSLFTTPARRALAAESHAEGSRTNVELGGEGVSRQAYGLRAAIAEVEVWARRSPVPVVEVHPEVSFAALHGRPLPHGKKTWAGTALRRRLLEGAGLAVPEDLGELGARAAVDDVLDAAAAAWSALRYARGQAVSFPDPPEVFGDGWPSAIWC